MRAILGRAFFCFVIVGMAAVPAAGQGDTSGAGAACSDPMAVLRAFYDDNDAKHFDASASLLTEDVAFATWAGGVNGRQMMLRHLNGRKALREFMGQGRGLSRRLPDSPPNGPVYHENRIAVSGNEVKFMLEPDRTRPDGKLYNYFSVDAVLDGCRIKSLTVIEQITWL
jgi:hypothetical protein